MDGKDATTPAAVPYAPQLEAPQPAPPAPQTGAPQPAPAEAARWGTRQMGAPAAPGSHPENQKAAQWTAARGDQEAPPYVIMGEPVAAPARRPEKGERDGPMEHILDFFNTWSRKAEELSSNIWLNLKTAPSMSDAAMGKLSLGAKALSGGGFEKLYRQTFTSSPDEQLRKTFACYLSTATGPVAGTLYLTNMNVAFCSDRPLSFTAPSGQTAWSYYKVVIPLGRVAAVEPVTMKEQERYVHVVTVDSHDFWFMGFVSYDKAVHHLAGAVSSQSQSQHGGAPTPPPAMARDESQSQSQHGGAPTPPPAMARDESQSQSQHGGAPTPPPAMARDESQSQSQHGGAPTPPPAMARDESQSQSQHGGAPTPPPAMARDESQSQSQHGGAPTPPSAMARDE